MIRARLAHKLTRKNILSVLSIIFGLASFAAIFSLVDTIDGTGIDFVILLVVSTVNAYCIGIAIGNIE